MVEEVEEFCANFDLKRLGDVNHLGEREVSVPETGPGGEVPWSVSNGRAIANSRRRIENGGVEPLVQRSVRDGEIFRPHVGSELRLGTRDSENRTCTAVDDIERQPGFDNHHTGNRPAVDDARPDSVERSDDRKIIGIASRDNVFAAEAGCPHERIMIVPYRSSE